MKMREIALPEGVKAEVKGHMLAISGKLGTNSRKFNDALVEIKAGQGKITLDHVKDKKLLDKGMNAENALSKEVQNDIKGVTQYFEFKMKSIHAHFPITVEVKGQDLNINNIIGERVPQASRRMAGGTKIEVKGQNVRLYGTSLDDVSQTAANIRKACRMRNKDTRVFQDGLYFEV
jgi:large subunit ribosomal protein L6